MGNSEGQLQLCEGLELVRFALGGGEVGWKSNGVLMDCLWAELIGRNQGGKDLKRLVVCLQSRL